MAHSRKKKRNHWVSQAYLKGFAANDAATKIWTLSNRHKDGGPERRPIDKVAVKFYLYAPFEREGKRNYDFENKLAELENLFGSPLWQAASSDYVDLENYTNRRAISLLVAVMYLRNPLRFEQWKQQHKETTEALSRFSELPTHVEINGRRVAVDRESWPSYRDADENELKRAWLAHVGSAAWLAEELIKMRWSMIASEKRLFVTTDNPVIIVHPSLRFRGLKDPQTAVMFPLSPTRLLVMDNKHGEPANQYYPENGIAAYVNGILWRDAIRYMFAHRDPYEIAFEIVRTEDHAA
jgi:hypothetical protein